MGLIKCYEFVKGYRVLAKVQSVH